LRSIIKYGICILNVILITNISIDSQSKSELEKIRKEKIFEIEKIENILSETKHDKSVSIQKIDLISKKIVVRNDIIDNLNVSIEDISKRIDILSEEINLRSNEINNLKQQYAKIVNTSYYRLKNYNLIMFILSAESFNQAYRRFYYLKEFASERKKLLNKINMEIMEYESIISSLKNDKVNKVIFLDEKEREKENLKNDKNNLRRLIANYNLKESNLKNELKELQEFTKKIESEIEKIIKEEAIAKKKRNSKKSSEEQLLTKSFAENKGNLPWPVNDGTVISLFGEHQHPVFKGILIKNNGIDITSKCNSAVVSVFNGVVSKIFAIKGANFAMIIRHGDFLTVYQNLQKISVKIGKNVRTKEIIGYSSCDNTSNISTVHFELWQELNKMDPMSWLNEQN
jgi:murein hydrolase activator